MHPHLQNLPLNPTASILEYNPISGLLALNKPTSIKSHPNKPNSIDRLSIILAPYNLDKQYYLLPNNQKLYLLNRLDSPTSGILLLSLNQDTANLIKKAFKNHSIQKTYLAILIGKAPSKPTTWRNPLNTQKLNSILRTQQTKGPKIAITTIKLLQYNPTLNLSLVQFFPKTGFTHQLRVQAALHNLPILNDKTYGNFKQNKHILKNTSIKRLCLHAHKTQLNPHFNLHANQPAEFNKIMSI